MAYCKFHNRRPTPGPRSATLTGSAATIATTSVFTSTSGAVSDAASTGSAAADAAVTTSPRLCAG